ncbi:MAG: hypothetical protein IH614_06240 [Desulfuromonadales bacterium]|nr:hypothetical protein [Desulfuromonadales bacterium]
MQLSFGQITELVRAAIKATLPPSGYCYIAELFPAEVIYEIEGAAAIKGAAYFKRSYAIVDNKVTLGEPVAVMRKIEFVPLKAACSFVASAAEEGQPAGLKWKVKVLEFGPDLQGEIFWEKSVMQAAVAQFNGAKVFAVTESQHLDKPKKFGKSVKELVGALTNPTTDDTGIYADIVIMPSAAWLRDDLVACEQNSIPYVYGLSVDISAKAAKGKVGGKTMLVPQKIERVQVDVVHEPRAGGQFIQLAAAFGHNSEGDDKMLQQLLAALKARRPDLYKGIQAKVDDGTITETEALDQITAAMSSPIVEMGEPMRAAVAEIVSAELLKAGRGGAQGGDALNQVNLLACRLVLRDELAGSKLPEVIVAKLQRRFEGQIFEVEQLRAAVKEEKEVWDQLTASGTVAGAGGVRIVLDQGEKVGTYLDDFFEGKVSSFKAAYVDITGDATFTGQTRNARLLASLNSGSFAEVLGDAITRRMLKEYNAAGLSDWRKIVEVVPVSDFRTQHRTRFGGYGDLPGVNEGAPYQALASPGDEEATYAPSKRGGTEDLTLEMIRNDDAGAVRRIPVKLGRSGARTLYKFVFDFLRTNALIYDNKALFHIDHSNLLAVAFAKVALQAARLQMTAQKDFGANDNLGLVPKYIVGPSTLEDTIYEVCVQPNGGMFTPTAPDAVRRQTWEPIINPFWTDANDWFLVADPKDIPTIEIAFLDGREEPELFVQDSPTVGSMFSTDKLTYKIRHIYGGAVMDYRGFQGNIVAGG